MLAILDPSLVVPHVGQDSASARAAIDSIVAMSECLGDGVLELASSDSLYELLASLDLFPLRELYDDVLSSLELEQTMSGSDVATLVLGILERCVPLESVVADFEVDPSSRPVISGLEKTCTCHAELESAASVALQLGAACAVVDSSWDPDFIVSHRAKAEAASIEVMFSTILGSDGAIVETSRYDRAIPVASSVEDAVPSLDVVRVLRRCSRDASAVGSAIKLGLRQRDPGANVPEWDLHSWFVEDITSPAVLNNESLARRAVRTCVDVITDSRPRDSHALRVGSGASAAQVSRGGCNAWRQDVDREWHVHFWRCGAGRLQFATLRGHAYVGIPDPEP